MMVGEARRLLESALQEDNARAREVMRGSEREKNRMMKREREKRRQRTCRIQREGLQQEQRRAMEIVSVLGATAVERLLD